jgi:polyisoprenoid-binding protein YceI
MKTFILVLVLILVVFFIFQISSKKDKQLIQPLEEVNYMRNSSFEDGLYVLANSASVGWSGEKSLVAGYVDSGILNIKEGNLKVETGTVTGNFVFDMTSITAETTGGGAGEDKLTTHLKSVDFFEVEKFPTSNLKITEMTLTGEENTYLVKGNFEMKGIKNNVEFPAKVFVNGNETRVVAEVSLDRTLWDVRFGSGKFFKNLADKVINDIFKVNVDIVLVK